MKKIILIASFILSQNQIGVGQKTFSISGTVTSVVTEKLFPQQLRVRIDNKKDFVSSKGAFKIKGLKNGNHIFHIENESYARDTFYRVYDTTILIQNTSLKDIKIIVPCHLCDCEERGYTKSSALIDVQKGLPKLLFIGGISGMDFSDERFWRFAVKYGLQLEDLGCVSPDSLCIDAYTNIVFEFLDKKYGKKWRKEVPKEVLGVE